MYVSEKTLVAIILLTIVILLSFVLSNIIRSRQEEEATYESWRVLTPRYLLANATVQSANISHWKTLQWSQCEWKEVNSSEAPPRCADLVKLDYNATQRLGWSDGLYVCDNGTACAEIQKMNCSVYYQKYIYPASCITRGQWCRDQFRAVLDVDSCAHLSGSGVTCATRHHLPTENVPPCDGGKRRCIMKDTSYEYNCIYPCMKPYSHRKCWMRYGTVTQLDQFVTLDYQHALRDSIQTLIQRIPLLYHFPYPFVTLYYQSLVTLLDSPLESLVRLRRSKTCPPESVSCIASVERFPLVLLNGSTRYWFDIHSPERIYEHMPAQELATSSLSGDIPLLPELTCALTLAAIAFLLVLFLPGGNHPCLRHHPYRAERVPRRVVLAQPPLGLPQYIPSHDPRVLRNAQLF